MSELTKIQENSQTEYFYSLLERIKERPGMYLGRCSITRLRMLLMGYTMARGELGLPLTEQEKEFARFQKWIQKRYDVTSSQGWESIILFYSADEKDAFYKFFDLLEQFYNDQRDLDQTLEGFQSSRVQKATSV